MGDPYLKAVRRAALPALAPASAASEPWVNRAATRTAQGILSAVANDNAAGFAFKRNPYGAAFFAGAAAGVLWTQYVQRQAGSSVFLPSGEPVFDPLAAGYTIINDCGRAPDSPFIQGAQYTLPTDCGFATNVVLEDWSEFPDRGVDLAGWGYYYSVYSDDEVGVPHPDGYVYVGGALQLRWEHALPAPDPFIVPAPLLIPGALPDIVVEVSNGQPATPREPAQGAEGVLGASGTMSRTPTRGRQPPRPREKERKGKALRAFTWVLKRLEDATELVDVEKALFDALPKDCKDKHKNRQKAEKARLGRLPDNRGEKVNLPGTFNVLSQGQAIYDCWNQIDLSQAVFNVIWGQMVEDFVWSIVGNKLPKNLQKQVFGDKPGAAFGRFLGDNSKRSESGMMGEDKSVSTVLKNAKDFTSSVLNTLFPGVNLDVTPDFQAQLSKSIAQKLAAVGIS